MYNSRIVGVNPYYLVPPVQLGGGYPEAELFRGLRRQRGSGALTSFLAAVARKLLPYAKSYVMPHATSAAKSFVQDLVDGKNIKEAAKERGVSALKSMGRQIASQSGSGRMRRRKTKKRVKRNKKSVKRQKGGRIRGKKKKSCNKQKLRVIRFKRSVLD